jgi:hypothetical protein
MTDEKTKKLNEHIDFMSAIKADKSKSVKQMTEEHIKKHHKKNSQTSNKVAEEIAAVVN